MLKINKLKIDISTTSGKKFGCFYEFQTDKLNIIKGGNHSGKTTIVSAIFFAMGMEEFLGGQNTKALDSILTSVVPYNATEYHINESAIYLEIENQNSQIVTIKRYSSHIDVSPKAVYIYESTLENIEEKSKDLTYIHDPGSAQHSLGFYKYLETFLGFDLPNVPSYDGKEIKLYLQVIFTAFFVEQLKGWTDFFATIPSYGIKDSKKRVVEFLLDLEASEHEKNKFKYEVEKERINKEWINYIEKIHTILYDISVKLEIKYDTPISIEQFRDSKFELFFVDEEEIKFEQHIETIQTKVAQLNTELEKPSNKNEDKLLKIRERLKNIARKISKLNEIISIKDNRLVQSREEYKNIKNEITKLTDLQKIKRYIGEDTITSKIAKGVCPTCQQPVDSSFYSKIEVMGVDDNKEYLVAQKKIIKVYIDSLEKEIEQQKNIVKFLVKEYEETQSIIKYLERDIALNTNMATYKKIVTLEAEVSLYRKIEKQAYSIRRKLYTLAKDWQINEMSKVSYELSYQDNQKIDLLQEYFKRYLFEFGYGSKGSEQIFISKKPWERYFPIVKIDGRDEKIRINSSASDFVRSLWAYYISLYEVSREQRGNHIGLFLFDEPAQHAMDESNQKAFLERLSKLNSCQSIVFSSFEDKDNSPLGKEKFAKMIEDIDKSQVHIIEIEEHSIQLIEEIK